MLEETCCTVKGGSIPDLENDRDALLESWLEARIRYVHSADLPLLTAS